MFEVRFKTTSGNFTQRQCASLKEASESANFYMTLYPMTEWWVEEVTRKEVYKAKTSSPKTTKTKAKK